MFDWGNLLKWDYWAAGFSGENALMYTESLSTSNPNFHILLWSFVSLVAVGAIAVIARIWLDEKNPLKKHLQYLSSNSITIGMLGLGWFLSRMFNFSFLSSRLVLLGLLAYFAVFLAMIIRYFIVFFPIEWKYYKKTK